MKALFNSSSKLLKYTLTFMCFAFLLGLIFSLTFGFNTSSEYGKVYEVTIYAFDAEKIESYKETAQDVLKEYGYTVKEIRVDEHTDADAVVLRYKSSSLNNALKIQADITEKLELNENLVKVEALTLSNQKSASIKLLITLGVAVLFIFIYAVIRHGWKMAVTLISLFVSSIILPLSVMAFSRIELSLTTLFLVSIIGTLASIIYMAMYAKLKSISKYQEKVKSFKENYLEFANENKLKVLIPVALMLLVFVCLIFTFNRTLVHVGLTGLVALAIASFSLVIFAPALQITLNKEEVITKTLKTKKENSNEL